MNKLILFLSVLCLAHLIYGCSQDWECGNPPYSFCLTNFDSFPGLGLDESENKLVMVGKYNNSQGPNGNPTLVSLSTSGGALTKEYEITTDIIGGSGYRVTSALFAYEPLGNLPYIKTNQRMAPAIGPYNHASNTYDGIFFTRGYNLGLAFDGPKDKTYWCDWSLNYLDRIILHSTDMVDRKPLMDGYMRCNFMSVAPNLLYVVDYFNYTTNSTNVYKIDSNCHNCSSSSLILVGSVPFEVYSFQYALGYLYFGTHPSQWTTQKSGIWKSYADTGGAIGAWITTDPVSESMVVDSTATFVYYKTGSVIKKIGPGAPPPSGVVIFDPAASPLGQCKCARGFTGAQCQTCTGTTRWVDGVPECVAKLPNGQPETCIYDYECLQVPFAYCGQGTCTCRSNFYGNTCQSCNGVVEWSYGFPSCNI
ncbi:hypothetical protein SAMD00019534_024370, partial [Acytostelium subglobosum LB1]|uniref:hypothetical protein n=1 Tax=Acytostelium subglobosum LB1 TaxID=1410327 RepID=UPI000644CC9A